MADGTVLVRLGALGDVALLGAVTGGLPGPVTVVTHPRYHGLARHLHGVERVVAPDEARGLAGRWIDLQRSLRSVRLAPFARRVRKHSLRRRLGWLGLSPRPTVPELYASACGVPVQPRPWLRLPVEPRASLVLLPGAAWAPKRPPAELLVEVGRSWSGPVVVLGGPGDDPQVQAVAAAIPGAVSVVERGFERTLRVLAGARVAVGGDSGLSHVAGAAGVPLVALFGPTSPRDGFAVHPGQVVEQALGCRPCGLHRIERCARGDQACLALPPSRVMAAVAHCAG